MPGKVYHCANRLFTLTDYDHVQGSWDANLNQTLCSVKCSAYCNLMGTSMGTVIVMLPIRVTD